MFALIISIIAIALVVALAGATLYYGGDAFTKGSARSTGAALINQGQQIAGAWTLAKADNGGALPADLAALSTAGYLAALPTSPVAGAPWTLAADSKSVTVSGTNVNAEICGEVSKMPGAGGVFECDTATNTFTYTL